MTTHDPFEDKLLASYHLPQADPAAQNAAWRAIQAALPHAKPAPRPRLSFWKPLLAGLGVLTILVLLIGPQKVWAQIRTLFGYIPGVGIIEITDGIRVLAEPAEVTVDGIIISVTQAILEPNKTWLTYHIFGLPGSQVITDPTAADTCWQDQYLRLPDGARVSYDPGRGSTAPNLGRTPEKLGYGPVPAGIDQATLVFPCLKHTRLGALPAEIELPLRFEPADPQAFTASVTVLTPPAGTAPTPAAENQPIRLTEVITTESGFILLGRTDFPSIGQRYISMQKELTLTDAAGLPVPVRTPEDLPSLLGAGWYDDPHLWALQFDATGVTFPVTLRQNGTWLEHASFSQIGSFTIDAAAFPADATTFPIDQSLTFQGGTLTLERIDLDPGRLYAFVFKLQGGFYDFDMQVEGTAPATTTGGVSDGEHATITRYFWNGQPLDGELQVNILNPILRSDPIFYALEFLPEVMPPLPAAALPAQCPACLTSKDLLALPATLPPAPTRTTPIEPGTPNLNDITLLPSGQVVPRFNQESVLLAFSSKTQELVRYVQGASVVIDTKTAAEQDLIWVQPLDLSWSPDGSTLAWIEQAPNRAASPYVVRLAGGQRQQVADTLSASLVGWSADGQALYYAENAIGDPAARVYRYDLATGTKTDLITIEGTRPYPITLKLSPDEKALAYAQHGSISLIELETKAERLVFDSDNYITFFWADPSHLALSLLVEDTPTGSSPTSGSPTDHTPTGDIPEDHTPSGDILEDHTSADHTPTFRSALLNPFTCDLQPIPAGSTAAPANPIPTN